MENFEPMQYNNENNNFLSLKDTDVFRQAIDLFKYNLTSFLFLWIYFQLPLLLFGNFFMKESNYFDRNYSVSQNFTLNFIIYTIANIILSFFYFTNFTSLIYNIFYNDNNIVKDAIKRASSNYSNQFVIWMKLFFFIILTIIAFVISAGVFYLFFAVLSSVLGGEGSSFMMLILLTLVALIAILFLIFAVAYALLIPGIYQINSKDIFDIVKKLLKQVKWKAFSFFCLSYFAVTLISIIIQVIIQIQDNLLVLKIISNFIMFPFSTLFLISQSTYIINLYELYKEANPESGIIPDIVG